MNGCAHWWKLHGPGCRCALCGGGTFGRCARCGETRIFTGGCREDGDDELVPAGLATARMVVTAQHRERAVAGRAKYNRRMMGVSDDD